MSTHSRYSSTTPSAGKYTILSAVERSRNILLDRKVSLDFARQGRSIWETFPSWFSVCSLGAAKYYPWANFIRIHDVLTGITAAGLSILAGFSPPDSPTVYASTFYYGSVFPSTPSREAENPSSRSIDKFLIGGTGEGDFCVGIESRKMRIFLVRTGFCGSRSPPCLWISLGR